MKLSPKTEANFSRIGPLPIGGLPNLPDFVRGAHVVVGNFDGVHLGHRKVVESAVRSAMSDGRPIVAVTYEPHTRAALSQAGTFCQLTDAHEKTRLLIDAGVDHVVTLLLDQQLAGFSLDAFVEEVLTRRLEALSVVVGQNFRFGRTRAVAAEQLIEAAERIGPSVKIVPVARLSDGGDVITSAGVRSRLAIGDVETANRMLGRRWAVEGVVVPGDRRGRLLGFPTANLALRSDARIGFGIYAVRVTVNDQIVGGVASYGTRPQFDDGAPRLEIYLLDFKGDIYGANLRVEFVAFQRPELKFANVDALLVQMNIDCTNARRLLGSDFRDHTTETKVGSLAPN